MVRRFIHRQLAGMADAVIAPAKRTGKLLVLQGNDVAAQLPEGVFRRIQGMGGTVAGLTHDGAHVVLPFAVELGRITRCPLMRRRGIRRRGGEEVMAHGAVRLADPG